MPRYQTPEKKETDRKDHIWVEVNTKEGSKSGYKCCLCGAFTKHIPPHYPTPEGWWPDRYEPLTDEERRLAARIG